MPTLWKHPESKYWFAKIILPDGRRTSRTTKQTNRRDALQAALVMEHAAALARRNELTQSAVVKLVRDLCEAVGAPAIQSKTIRQHFTDYIEGRRALGCSPATLARYRPIMDGFLAHLGAGRANAGIASLTASEVESFRNAEIASGKGSTTADFAVKILRSVLRDAHRKGMILHNPAEAVASTGAHAQERDPFTPQELRDILDEARDTDWEGMILVGAHAGLRLVDAARLTWDAVELDSRTLTFVPRKARGRKIVIALHSEVVNWLKLRSRGIGKAPIFPTLCHQKSGSAGGLSNAFSDLMTRAKIIVPRGIEREGKGRTFRTKGFHSLRHTMISRMADANVSADVRRAVAGHASDSAHRRYVHLSIETQRRAIEGMPALGGKP